MNQMFCGLAIIDKKHGTVYTDFTGNFPIRSARQRAIMICTTKPTLDNQAIWNQIWIEQGLIQPPARKRPHPANLEADLKSNKRLKNLDYAPRTWLGQLSQGDPSEVWPHVLVVAHY